LFFRKTDTWVIQLNSVNDVFTNKVREEHVQFINMSERTQQSVIRGVAYIDSAISPPSIDSLAASLHHTVKINMLYLIQKNVETNYKQYY